jgi:GMP synthase-like glutamine amidotransferase
MKTIKVHCFQHVHFEDLGCIGNWIDKNGHTIQYTQFYENYSVPNADDYDWLVVMGGPMSVNDENEFPWLADEKKAVKEAIEKNKTVIGICLGSQLIANVLGEVVYKNQEREIGWFDISLTGPNDSRNLLNSGAANNLKVFHWHGETYKIPANSVHLAYSAGCKSQAFLYNEKVLGLQFHLEVTEQSIAAMIGNGRNELVKGKFVQSESEILAQTACIESNNGIMFQILDKLAKQ